MTKDIATSFGLVLCSLGCIASDGLLLTLALETRSGKALRNRLQAVYAKHSCGVSGLSVALGSGLPIPVRHAEPFQLTSIFSPDSSARNRNPIIFLTLWQVAQSWPRLRLDFRVETGMTRDVAALGWSGA